MKTKNTNICASKILSSKRWKFMSLFMTILMLTTIIINLQSVNVQATVSRIWVNSQPISQYQTYTYTGSVNNYYYTVTVIAECDPKTTLNGSSLSLNGSGYSTKGSASISKTNDGKTRITQTFTLESGYQYTLILNSFNPNGSRNDTATIRIQNKMEVLKAWCSEYNRGIYNYHRATIRTNCRIRESNVQCDEFKKGGEWVRTSKGLTGSINEYMVEYRHTITTHGSMSVRIIATSYGGLSIPSANIML